MLPSQRARTRDRARQGPRRTVIVFRCPRCHAEYDKQPFFVGVAETLTDNWCKRPGCPKCSLLGYLDRVRGRE